MTDRSKFEQMLEYLISEEQDKAKELFHQLVVEKSREIYETILSEDFEQVEEETDEDDEDETKQDESIDEFALEADDEEEGDDEVGGDSTDDFIGDLEKDEEGEEGEEGDMGDEGGVEDRVADLEDAMDELKADFERMMSGEEMPSEEPGMDDMGDMGDMGSEEPQMPVKDSFDVSDNFMREYIEKVANPKHGDDGANVKSPVAGKNDMGGTTANIAKGGEAKGEGTKGGLLNPSAKEENFGNINVPGGKAGNAFSKKEPGHGAEKKGTAPQEDKGAGSPINGAPGRAK